MLTNQDTQTIFKSYYIDIDTCLVETINNIFLCRPGVLK